MGEKMTQRENRDNVWTIILAGGEGRRLSPMISRWIGRHKPKQYCTFLGTRSMFQHTVDRADQISAPDRKIIVIGRTHIEEATAQLEGRIPGKIISQPNDRGTAAGIFIALTYIKALDSEATVVICPSDHFIYPDNMFIQTIRNTAAIATKMKYWSFLLGVKPDRPEPDYGYIFPGANLAKLDGRRIFAVDDFMEKPDSTKCISAISRGALWNTLILVAKVDALWQAGWQSFPTVMKRFEHFVAAIGTSQELEKLDALYKTMPIRNFSSDLLQQSHNHLAVVELDEVLWCDWGRPERIVESIQRIGKKPVFSPGLTTVVTY
jgi:mannose-1-phosphate guanylyltransferase